MKTLDQIIRYVSHCSFGDSDWQKVLDYCRERYKGGKVHRAKQPISESTYEQFLKWIDTGFGSGDFVSYGKTMGMVGSSTPAQTYLVAYCDFNGKLIVKRLDIQEPSRLAALNEVRKNELLTLMAEKELCFYPKLGKIDKLYIPKKFSYVIVSDDKELKDKLGMYLESDGYNHHFAGLLEGGKLTLDCWVYGGCTPLRPATTKETQQFHKALSKAGWSFNGRTNTFVKQPKRGHNNTYWYLSDRFTIIADKDNGSDKHTERFEAGNYFLDYTEAILFMKEVKELRKDR